MRERKKNETMHSIVVFRVISDAQLQSHRSRSQVYGQFSFSFILSSVYLSRVRRA